MMPAWTMPVSIFDRSLQKAEWMSHYPSLRDQPGLTAHISPKCGHADVCLPQAGSWGS
jgi:hypothetical protein